jgi:hypothetical protein
MVFGIQVKNVAEWKDACWPERFSPTRHLRDSNLQPLADASCDIQQKSKGRLGGDQGGQMKP